MTFTRSAAEIILEKGKDQVLLVSSSGCYHCSGGGVYFMFGNSDLSQRIDGVKVFIPPGEENLVHSLEIDYQTDERGGYFSIFNNGLYSTVDEKDFFNFSSGIQELL